MGPFSNLELQSLTLSEETRSVVTERELPHPVEKVWRAITQGPLLEEWLMMIVSGWLTGFVISNVFAHPGALLPADFSVFPTFRIHAALAAILTAVLVAHVVAALWHQFGLRDGLFSRMWIGRGLS